MRGPCADGYHVPTGKEWCDAIASITGNAWCDATAHDDTSVVSTLKLPLSGYRDYSSAAYFNQGIFGHYRTSTPLVSGGTHNVNFSTTQAYPAMASIRGYGFSVRCLKN